MNRVATEAHNRGCTVAMQPTPLPYQMSVATSSYIDTAERLLESGSVDILFASEWEAPSLLRWEREHMPLVMIEKAERAAESILLR